jgi:hypothetical protein
VSVGYVIYIFDENGAGAEGQLKFEINNLPLVGSLLYLWESSEKTFLFTRHNRYVMNCYKIEINLLASCIYNYGLKK